MPRLPPQNIAHATFMQPLQCDLQPPFIKVKSQSHTTLQGQVSIAQHPSRSSLNPICNHPSSRSCEVSHHPSRSSLNRPPPLQGQVSIAHHPSRSSLNRTPPFKVKSQSRTTLQGQVSIAHHPPHHPSRSSVNRAPPFLNRAPPFKVKSQSHTTLQGQVSIAHHLHTTLPSVNRAQSRTTLQGQVSIAHHPSRSSVQSRTTPSSFQDSDSICPYLGSIASQLPLTTLLLLSQNPI